MLRKLIVSYNISATVLSRSEKASFLISSSPVSYTHLDVYKRQGNGLVFLEFDGHIKEYELAPGQQLVIDTGYLAAMTGSCQLEIQTVPGIKNVVFGGEGLFNTVVTGPGRVWLQSMPVSQLAGAIRPFIPTGN